MSKITAALIKEVREKSGAPIMRSKQVLEEVMKGNLPAQAGKEKAIEILKKEGFAKMEKRTDRQTSAGLVATYNHHTGSVAAIVEMLVETDFVAKNELFVELSNNVAMQVASMNPKDEKELLAQPFIKDPKKTIEELVKEVITKTGENINIGRFTRIEIGN